MKKILVVDDEERIVRLMTLYLEREGYQVDYATNGADAIFLHEEMHYDCILLDVMMPEIDGISACHKIRETSFVPIIMVSAKGNEEDRILGFECGADDYIVKPFSPRELVLRVQAVMKRSVDSLVTPTNHQNAIQLGDLRIDHDAHRVTIADKEVILTPKEYDLLLYLAQSPDKVFSRETLLTDVWHYEFFGDLRTVDTHIKRLREKLNDHSPTLANRIATVWGVGYKFSR
ncbi:transcriptional regulatory protein ResD [Lysinibacillus alkalisoli]|uniref:Transcriptional regulatory protein ResD n=1 Tax=Lysinibacillus alkalisoli TaxID=1911548 RepID=A0A917LE13_9BACI|nr:response regulator transcription factor [Lysinibacillus alkalisoli]GGG14814.1 transcriptional regulatory protein ResD [Lysinibacillus alkalisoli]